MSKPRIVVVLLSIVSVGAIGFALYHRVIAGTFLYDSNFETFHEVLNDEQRRGIAWSLDAITAAYVWMLVITNLLWAGAAWYLLLKARGIPGRAVAQPTEVEPKKPDASGNVDPG